MRKPSKWQGAKKSESFNRLVPGGYVVTIMNVEEYRDNCLKVSYDIAEGQFKNYYSKQYEQWGGTWRGTSYQAVESRSGDVLASFSNFIYCIEASNRGYTWNWDERTLKGLKVGIVLREEEWINNEGEVKTTLKLDEWKTIADISNGNFKVKDTKKADKPQTNKQVNNNTNFNVDDNDIQF